MSNWVNWLLVIGGVACAAAEVWLGVATGFDLALIGASLATGGALGLVFGSTKIGLFSAGALAFVYIAFFRRWLRGKLTHPERRSNVAAVIGQTGIVKVRIGPHQAGQVKVGAEVWRAELAAADGKTREPGETITVEAVEGVTLKVR